MERPNPTAVATTTWTLPTWAGLLGLTALLLWHGWLTLSLFGETPWNNLVNDQPIVSGNHPQHLYIGSVGAFAVSHHGRITALDHRFQCLWPQTPIFNGGRVAEAFLLCGGGSYQPAAYKIGFAVLCMLVPIFLVVACKAVNLGHATSIVATVLGLLIWWGPHGRTAILTGDCEHYFAALAALAHVGLLIAFHRTAGIWAWSGVFLTGCMGWFLQPLFFPIALPVLLIYYLSVGVKHEFLSWHVAFWSAEVLAFLVNLPWLIDWLDSWWLRTPLPLSTDLLEHRTFVTVWNAPLWGGSTSRLLAIFVSLSSAVGVIVLNQTKQRPAARMLGMSAGGALVLALLGIAWEPLGTVGTAALLAPALWFACIPAAHAWIWTIKKLLSLGSFGQCALVVLLLSLTAGLYLLIDDPHTLLERFMPGEPLEIGLGSKREAIVEVLKQATTDDARILWEDHNRSRQVSRWPALLPILTERSYIGGLDPDGFIEHSSICLINESLVDIGAVALAEDHQLREYCRLYNIRWIVAWSPSVIERLDKWKDAVKHTQLVDVETGWLFEVNRTPNFALKGKADLLEADAQSITLGNVEPKDGEVVISLHYHASMRASPGRVQIERATSGDDPIGFVRLRLAVPAARVTLTWER
jgi:hypothetical protein